MSYDNLVDTVKAAMAYDAFNNPEHTERCTVSEQDVSDCPDLDQSKDLIVFEITEDVFMDVAYDLLMREVSEYAS